MDAVANWDKNSKKARCDYSYHMCITHESQIEQLGEVVEQRGITSLKCFMAYKNALMLDDATLIKCFKKCKELGVLVSVHAENGELVAAGQSRIYASGITGPEGHPLSRPNHHEYEACERAIIYAEDVNTPLCIVHNTTSGSVKAIRRAHARGSRIFGEATMAHLAMTEERYYTGSFEERAACVLSPPLRSKADQEALWNALTGGVLCNVVTDHCGFNKAQKAVGKDDFRKIPNGCPGMEERMPVVWTLGVVTGRLTPTQFVALTSTNTAKLYNMYPQKGVIEVGSDADFVIWDENKQHVVSASTHHSSLDINPMEGFVCKGYPDYVISAGMVAVKNDVVLAEQGHGKYVSRRPFGYAFEGFAARDLNNAKLINEKCHH
jgi:dihydropyrimidinase